MPEDWRLLRFGTSLRSYLGRADAVTGAHEPLTRWARDVIRRGPPEHGIESSPEVFFDGVHEDPVVLIVYTVAAYEELVIVAGVY